MLTESINEWQLFQLLMLCPDDYIFGRLHRAILYRYHLDSLRPHLLQSLKGTQSMDLRPYVMVFINPLGSPFWRKLCMDCPLQVEVPELSCLGNYPSIIGLRP